MRRLALRGLLVADEEERLLERIFRERYRFQSKHGYKPKNILIHYEGWHEILRDKGSNYYVRVGLEPPMQVMGMAVIRTADIGKTEFIVF